MFVGGGDALLWAALLPPGASVSDGRGAFAWHHVHDIIGGSDVVVVAAAADASAAASIAASTTTAATAPSSSSSLPVCFGLGLGDRSDTVVLTVCQRFVKADLGTAAMRAFVRCVLLRKALALTKPASRLLVSAAAAAAAAQPLVSACVLYE